MNKLLIAIGIIMLCIGGYLLYTYGLPEFTMPKIDNPLANKPLNLTKKNHTVVIYNNTKITYLNCNDVVYYYTYQCGNVTSTSPNITCSNYPTIEIEHCNMPNQWVCAKGKTYAGACLACENANFYTEGAC